MIDRARLERYVTDSRRRFEDLLGQMVEIPSISMDPAKAPDIRRMAEFARQVLTDLGADAQIVETGGYPIVSGGLMTGVHHPTVTIYNHMDVQPAQEPEWTQAPFAFKNENGMYHGRGATDDKGPALSALFGARYAIEQGVPINVRFLWELEEEIGSPHFAAGLKNREAIPSSRFRGRVGYHLDRKRKARHALWSARPVGRASYASDWNERRPFWCDRRRCAESARGTDGSGARLRRCQDRQGEDSRVLSGCGRTDQSRDQELPCVRVSRSRASSRPMDFRRCARTIPRRSCAGSGPRRRLRCMA